MAQLASRRASKLFKARNNGTKGKVGVGKIFVTDPYSGKDRYVTPYTRFLLLGDGRKLKLIW